MSRRPARPWSIVRRLTGGVALIALLSFVVQALVLAVWMRPVIDRVAATAASQALTVQAALLATAPELRDALAERLSQGEVQVTRLPPPAQGPGAQRAFLPRPPPLDETLGGLLPAGIKATAVHQGEQVVIRFQFDVQQQAWWLSRSIEPPNNEVQRTLAIWLLVLTALTLSALLLLVRWVARPLADVAVQIAQRHDELRPLQQLPHASVEVVALVHAFNQLVAQVQAAASARQQLLAGVSHDLRTPLARLRLRVETQLEPLATAGADNPASVAQLVRDMNADLSALEHIVAQFLSYVQGEAPGTGLQPAAPHQALGDVLCASLVPYLAIGHNIQVDMADSASADVAVHPVPALPVQRLLSNLIDNALAYGRPPVAVGLRREPGAVVLSVSDQGPGLSDEEFTRALQPFVRLTQTRAELGHCGLGLAIVAQMARQLGGRLCAGREPSGRFVISLVLPDQA
jgi:two-component system, OmpR family, osmolarity sensor histidine kinase EnvZ